MIDGRRGCFGSTQSMVWHSVCETVANWRHLSNKEWALISRQKNFSALAKEVFGSDKCFHCGRTSTRTWMDRGFCTKHKDAANIYTQQTRALPAASLEKLKAAVAEATL